MNVIAASTLVAGETNVLEVTSPTAIPEGVAASLCNTLVPANAAECSHSGGAQADEAACAACHGRGAELDVARVHPISEKPQ